MATAFSFSRFVWIALLGGLSLSGCGATSRSTGSLAGSGDLEQYFVGTQVIRLPDGTEQDPTPAVAHRTLRPDEHAILEETIARDPWGELESHALRLDVDPSNTRFILREPGTPISGEGELTGEPWNWTAWHVQTRLPDGTIVVTDDFLSATDLRAESRVIGTDGAPRFVIRQILTRVTRERYERERAEMESETGGPSSDSGN